MTNEISKLEQQIQKFMPFNEQEEHDKAILLKWFESGSDILTRENEIAHLTGSCVGSESRQKSVLWHITTSIIPGRGLVVTQMVMPICTM